MSSPSITGLACRHIYLLDARVPLDARLTLDTMLLHALKEISIYHCSGLKTYLPASLANSASFARRNASSARRNQSARPGGHIARINTHITTALARFLYLPLAPAPLVGYIFLFLADILHALNEPITTVLARCLYLPLVLVLRHPLLRLQLRFLHALNELPTPNQANLAYLLLAPALLLLRVGIRVLLHALNEISVYHLPLWPDAYTCRLRRSPG